MDEREADINSSVYIIVFSLIVCLTFTVWQWWSYSAKKKKIEKKAGLQPLLPPLPKHNIQQRQEVVKSIRLKFTSIRDRCPSHDSVLSVYLEGPPAFGKTQAARQFAKEYYRMNAQKRDVVVGTLNASTRSELLDSYVQLAAHLGLKININQIPPDERLNRGLQFVSNTVRNLLKSKDEWLLIVDNLTSEVKQMDYDDVERIDSSRILPQSGCEDWGYGYVLITTKEGSLVEKGGSVFSDYYYLDHGFSEEEGIKFLTSTCGINNDDELSDAKKLIKNLEGIPLSVAAAGCYIVKERSYRRNYSFSKYLKDLDKTHRDFAEQQTKQINNYPWTLTTALLMCILQQRPLYKVFCFLSSCAHAPMPMRLIARVLKEDLEVVTPAIQEVRDSVLLQIAYWSTTNDDDPIPVVQTHEVTWNVMRNLYYQNLDINRSHENIGQQIPTIAELNSIQIVDWFSLGLKLGINEYELNVIQTNDPKDNKACKRTMFSMWLRTDLKATFRKLIFALEEIGEVKVAKDLRKQNSLLSIIYYLN